MAGGNLGHFHKYRMSNCLNVIVKAMRRIGVIGSGQFPTDDEQADALDTLRDLYHRWANDGCFGTFVDVVAPDNDFTPLPGQRVYFATPTTDVLSLPDTAPDNSMIVVIDQSTNQLYEYIFSAKNRTWIDINALELTSEAPFSARDQIGLSCALAVELAAEYGQEDSLGQTTMESALRFQAGLVYNWSEREPPKPCGTGWVRDYY